jgi:molybdopterin-binding protein
LLVVITSGGSVICPARLWRVGAIPFHPQKLKPEPDMTIQSINVRNQFRGKIREIILGPVVSEVDVDTGAGIVTSVITTRSVKDLNLQVGSEVLAFVKATEVSIAKL